MASFVLTSPSPSPTLTVVLMGQMYFARVANPISTRALDGVVNNNNNTEQASKSTSSSLSRFPNGRGEILGRHQSGLRTTHARTTTTFTESDDGENPDSVVDVHVDRET